MIPLKQNESGSALPNTKHPHCLNASKLASAKLIVCLPTEALGPVLNDRAGLHQKNSNE